YAIDRAGNDTTFYFDYTPDSVTATPDTLRYGGGDVVITVDSFTIANPLSRSVNVDSVWLARGKNFQIVSGGAPPSFTLTPGEQKIIVAKFLFLNDSSDTIMVRFDCFSRPLAVLIVNPPNAVNEPGPVPQNISLAQNAPNPFSEMTNVEYRIPNDEKVSLNVYNALGRQVATLVNGFAGGGEHTAMFNATGLPAGVYIARLQAGGAVVQRMMQVVR
ncbi:MAG TPA: T9SS type A sorting domain-containing protein, partial [Candidatus Kapabacteria bacterium]|nr:T9SS type A sorting domain-containing protein [Candidatus Kapabacteria bacterium]